MHKHKSSAKTNMRSVLQHGAGSTPGATKVTSVFEGFGVGVGECVSVVLGVWVSDMRVV